MLDKIIKFLDELADLSVGVATFTISIMLLVIFFSGTIYLGFHFPVVSMVFLVGCFALFGLYPSLMDIDTELTEEITEKSEDYPKSKVQLKVYTYKDQDYVPYRIEIIKDGEVQAEYFRYWTYETETKND